MPAARIASSAVAASPSMRCTRPRTTTWTAATRLAVEIAHQSAAIIRVALDAIEQRRVGRDEGQIEQLGIGFLLEVDAFLLVALVLHGALDGVERPARQEALVEDVVDVHVVMAAGVAGSLG